MIRIVTPDIAGQFAAELAEMHRLRYRVFRERMNWNVQVVDGMERDQFDDCRPTYLLAYDRTHCLAGAWRLLPTTGPYMLRDVFSELLEGTTPPCHPGIWETSRFAVDCDLDTTDGLKAVNRITAEMFCGLLEHCLANAIHEMITGYDARIARLLGRLGGPRWSTPKWRSARHQIGDTRAYAGRWDVAPEILLAIRERGGIAGSVLMAPIVGDTRVAA